MKPRILLLGRTGQLGRELERSLAVIGDVSATSRSSFDLTLPDSLYKKLNVAKPTVIVNAAAFTAVDRAEVEWSVADTINGESVGELARWAYDNEALLVTYSTDYVFDGQSPSPYSEQDVCNPLSAYGRSKFKGEQLVSRSGTDHLIVRTSWVFSARGANFLKTMLRLLSTRDEIRVVSDQVGAPTYARNLADATAHLVRSALLARRNNCFESLVLHCTSSGHTSWYEFAHAIQERLPVSHPGRRCRITPVTASEYGALAARPQNSQLNNHLLTSRFELQLPHWSTALDQCFDDMCAEGV